MSPLIFVLVFDSRHSVENNILTIQSVQPNHSGKYVCTVTGLGIKPTEQLVDLVVGGEHKTILAEFANAGFKLSGKIFLI